MGAVLDYGLERRLEASIADEPRVFIAAESAIERAQWAAVYEILTKAFDEGEWQEGYCLGMNDTWDGRPYVCTLHRLLADAERHLKDDAA